MSKQNEETRVVTAHIPRPLASKLDEMAQRLDRPRVWIMKRALTEWIEREEERQSMDHFEPNAETLEAMTELEQGRGHTCSTVEELMAELRAPD